jgi:transposase
MRKIREVLRLKFNLELSDREIALSCNMARSTIQDYVKRAHQENLNWPLPEELDDDALETLLFKRVGRKPPDHPKISEPDWAVINTELKRGAAVEWDL